MALHQRRIIPVESDDLGKKNPRDKIYMTLLDINMLRCFFCYCKVYLTVKHQTHETPASTPQLHQQTKKRRAAVSVADHSAGNLSEGHCPAGASAPPEGPRHQLIKYTSAAAAGTLAGGTLLWEGDTERTERGGSREKDE